MARPSGPVRVDDSPAGALVKQRRSEATMTQARLADLAGVSRKTVNAMETGDYAPSVFLAIRVARALDCTVEDLWGSSVSS